MMSVVEGVSSDRLETAGEQASPQDLRQAIPREGLREYWYPGLIAKKVGRRRPESAKILGETVVFFRGSSDNVIATTDACPHRGAALSKGRCHFKGTLTCPYHGWTFDETGSCLAVLGEGTDSVMPGQPATSVRLYPTHTLKGVVFIWMGKGAPAPIEEDVPPEFFRDDTLVMHSVTAWRCNWRPAVENKLDAHVFYVHRNSLRMWTHPYARMVATLHRWDGMHRPKTIVVNERALAMDEQQYKTMKWSDDSTNTDFRYTFSRLGGSKWPRTRFRLLWAKIVVPLLGPLRGHKSCPYDAEWSNMHLPAIVRVNNGAYIYTRSLTPVNEELTRVFYFHTRYVKNRWQRSKNAALYRCFYTWFYNNNFSGQDEEVVAHQYYDTPEMFSPSDGLTIDWRRLVINHARRVPQMQLVKKQRANDA